MVSHVFLQSKVKEKKFQIVPFMRKNVLTDFPIQRDSN